MWNLTSLWRAIYLTRSRRSASLFLVLLAIFLGRALDARVREKQADVATLTITNAPAPALDWQKCDENDVADAGLRAFRNEKSEVVGIASHYETRLAKGPTLLKMKKQCAVSLDSAANPNPSAHNDRTWLLATWTDDGRNILGIGHDEYHGENHRGRCKGTTPRQCRYGTLVFLNSRDGGEQFKRTPTRPLVAVPVRQAPDFGKDVGFFQPSNIFRNGRFKYVFVRTSGGGTQTPATCLLRSDNPLAPDSWRIYDGKTFRLQRFDPYLDNPAAYRNCAQVPALNGMVWSVLTHEPTGKLVALLTVIDPVTRQNRLAISTAADPLHWSKPHIIAADFFDKTPGCGKDAAYWYPSLVDPTSKSRNFDTTGNDPLIFVTHMKVENCKLSMVRDLYYVQAHLQF